LVYTFLVETLGVHILVETLGVHILVDTMFFYAENPFQSIWKLCRFFSCFAPKSSPEGGGGCTYCGPFKRPDWMEHFLPNNVWSKCYTYGTIRDWKSPYVSLC